MGVVVLIIVVILIIVLLKVLLGVLFIMPSDVGFFNQKAHALNMVCSMKQGSLVGYNIYVNVKINGHPLKMLLDTGCDISVISGSYVQSLGLDRLPSQESVPMTSMSGQTVNEQSVNVQMCIEQSKCFNTPILINPQQLSGIHGGADNMLSLHDLYQGYRVTFTPLK